MATITYSLSVKSTANGKSEIIIRFRHAVNGKGTDKQARSGIFVNKDYFKDGKVYLSSKRLLNEENKTLKEELKQTQDELNELSNYITDSFIQTGAGKHGLPKDWLKDIIEDFHRPKPNEEELRKAEEEANKPLPFFETFEGFIKDSDVSENRKRHYWVVYRALQRFEAYNNLSLSFEDFNGELLEAFSNYLLDEYKYYSEGKLKKVLLKYPETRPIEQRGKNHVKDMMGKLRSFFIWSCGKTSNEHQKKISKINPFNPFNEYTIGKQDDLANPYYITIEQRNKLYNTPMPTERLEREKDIFVAQCFIGCRVGDFMKLTWDNVVNNCIQYIPAKTCKNRAELVIVPIAETLMEILERYKDDNRNKLLPFVAQQQYNEDIKEMLTIAGITDMVTVRDSKTGAFVQRPINEIASSHMARRTFTGNMYQSNKDPNLICKMTGHKEGSKAFGRYRTIDIDNLREAVSKLEKKD